MSPDGSRSSPDELDLEKSGADKHPKSEDQIVATVDDQLVAGSAYEKKLVRKLDLHIVPVAMLLHLCSFLDR
jgi:hypothetical protein